MAQWLWAALIGLILLVGPAEAVRHIVLQDGSVLVGEVLGLANGIYTIRLSVGATMQIEEAKVVRIEPSSEPQPPPLPEAGRPPGVTATPAPPAPGTLRLVGSNTIGEELIPE